MKPNILFIIESSETGGAENIFSEIVSRVDQKKYNFHIALLYDGWLHDQLIFKGFKPHLIRTHKGRFDFLLLSSIFNFVLKHNIDLIHSHLFSTNLYSSIVSAFTKTPVISTFHGTMDVNFLDPYKSIKWKIINKFSARIVFVSNYLRHFFLSNNLASLSKSIVIHNGIDINRFCSSVDRTTARNNLGLSQTSFIVGCVGDLRHAKDYPTAIKAVYILKKEIPSIKLIVFGTKTEILSDLNQLCDDLGLSNDVIFMGFHSDIPNILPAFDIYLSTSISEGFSLSIVEAMVSGIPIVSTRSGGPEEIIKDGLTGLLVKPNCIENIVEAILLLYRNSSLSSKFVHAAKQSAYQKYSINLMVENYQALYNKLINTSF